LEYLAPIGGDFESRGEALPSVTVEKFLRTLRRHGKARNAVAATLTGAGKKVATFSGEYVALKLDRAWELTQS
jgi:thioesterase domain-containing protein